MREMRVCLIFPHDIIQHLCCGFTSVYWASCTRVKVNATITQNNGVIMKLRPLRGALSAEEEVQGTFPQLGWYIRARAGNPEKRPSWPRARLRDSGSVWHIIHSPPDVGRQNKYECNYIGVGSAVLHPLRTQSPGQRNLSPRGTGAYIQMIVFDF